MNALQRFWNWLTGQSEKPIALYIRFEDENGIRGMASRSDSYEQLSEQSILFVEARQGDQELPEERAIALTRGLYEKDGFYANANSAAYEIESDGESYRPGEVPPGASITKMTVKCLIPAQEAHDLES